MTTGKITLTLTIGDDGIPRTEFESDISDVTPANMGRLYGAMVVAVVAAAESAINECAHRGRPDQALIFSEGFRSAQCQTSKTIMENHTVVEQP